MVKVSLKSRWLQQDVASPVLLFMEAKPHVFYAAAFLVLFEMGVVFNDVRFTAQQLIHALRGGHSHELLRALLGFGVLGVVLIAMLGVSPFLRKLSARSRRLR
jgi:hypothetical protein